MRIFGRVIYAYSNLPGVLSQPRLACEPLRPCAAARAAPRAIRAVNGGKNTCHGCLNAHRREPTSSYRTEVAKITGFGKKAKTCRKATFFYL